LLLDVLTKGCNKFKVDYMVQRFRKKPVVVEAIQFMGENVDAIIEFCGSKVKSHPVTGVVIITLEGYMTASNLDWIIKDVNGEFYPCKPDIFEKTYESADTPQSKTPIILFDRSIIPDGVSVDDFIEDINSGRPTGVFPPGGRSIKDVIAVINR
jgi:hypothetical protein